MVKPTPTKFGWKIDNRAPDPIGSDKVRHRDPEDKVFPETDKVAVQLPLRDETDKRVSRVVCYRNFIAKEYQPHLMWRVFSIVGSDGIPGADLPVELQGSYTSQAAVTRAIDQYLIKQPKTEKHA